MQILLDIIGLSGVRGRIGEIWGQVLHFNIPFTLSGKIGGQVLNYKIMIIDGDA
jgi:hypothetical protein